MVLRCFRSIFAEDLPERLPGILRTLRDVLEGESGLAALAAVMRYLGSGSSRVTRGTLRKALFLAFLTHGFGKQRARVPGREIELALRRKATFKKDPGAHSFPHEAK